jgi:hypothetical protein
MNWKKARGGKSPTASFCEDGKEFSYFIKGNEILDELNN